MKLDYCQIMGLSRPPGALDISALEQIWELYTVLLNAFLARDIPHDQPRHKKRAQYYRRMVSATLRDVRLGKIYNFALRVKSWVLSSRRRRLQLRALIGEHKIARWQAQVEARLCAETLVPQAPEQDIKLADLADEVPIEPVNFPRRTSLRPWYRLPTLPRYAVSQNFNIAAGIDFAAAYPRDIQHINTQHRAIPAIPFWPHELVENYIADDEALGNLQEDPQEDQQEDSQEAESQQTDSGRLAYVSRQEQSKSANPLTKDAHKPP